jgi:hypothetical protein
MLTTVDGVAGFSSEVILSSPGVAESQCVRQTMRVKTTNAIVQAMPPSMP